MNEGKPIIGIKLTGYCEGYFGRDDYDDKIIIACGDDWIVCRSLELGCPTVFTSFNSKSERDAFIERNM